MTKFVLLSLFLVVSSFANEDMSEVKITGQKLGKNTFMLQGKGGNIGVSAGRDGVLIVDDQFAPLSPKIKKALQRYSKEPVKFVINTHYHYDHTGGNEAFGKSGAVIVAHKNVRKRMSEDQFIKAFNKKIKAYPREALPVVTFTKPITLHWNDDEIEVIPQPAAHTDGDSFVYFKKANVLHMGDTFFNGLYPFIDVDAGGSLAGMIAAVDRALEITNGRTKIIPGHGPAASRRDLKNYRKMLKQIHDRVHKLVAKGNSLEDIKKDAPTSSFDKRWGNGFLSPEVFLGIVFHSVSKNLQAKK